MNGKEDLFEKYRREMMEMHRRAKPEEEVLPDWSEEDLTEKEEPMPDFELEEEMEREEQKEENVYISPMPEESHEENGQTEDMPSVCPLCAGGIALCEFSVEDAKNGEPIEYAQILLHRSDGFFIRALTGENGKTCEIPVFAHELWKVSITAQGYISVSEARIEPIEGQKVSIPVRLDESLSLNDIFAENKSGIVGA